MTRSAADCTPSPIGDGEKEVVRQIQSFAKWLNWNATALQILTVLVALTAIVLSLFVATYTQGSGTPVASPPGWINLKLLAFLSAVFTSVYTGFRIRSKAADMRNAYRLLAADLMRYRIGEITASRLIQSYQQAERLIGHVEVEALGDRSEPSTEPQEPEAADPS